MDLCVICMIILCVFILLILSFAYEILKLSDVSSLFWIMLILSIVSFITISVLANRSSEDNSGEYVKITKKEYELLLSKSKQLDEILNKKESQ